ncbi:MAG: hypothetical protein AABX64_01990 [Nanoarchaeota archaeon]
MKLTIDTQVDTHEDIRKVLQILTSILEKKDSSASPAADTTNLMGMFSDEQKGTVETKGNAPDFSSFLNLTQKSEKKDKPQLEYY